jgi:hypothetical protein
MRSQSIIVRIPTPSRSAGGPGNQLSVAGPVDATRLQAGRPACSNPAAALHLRQRAEYHWTYGQRVFPEPVSWRQRVGCRAGARLPTSGAAGPHGSLISIPDAEPACRVRHGLPGCALWNFARWGCDGVNTMISTSIHCRAKTACAPAGLAGKDLYPGRPQRGRRWSLVRGWLSNCIPTQRGASRLPEHSP